MMRAMLMPPPYAAAHAIPAAWSAFHAAAVIAWLLPYAPPESARCFRALPRRRAMRARCRR